MPDMPPFVPTGDAKLDRMLRSVYDWHLGVSDDEHTHDIYSPTDHTHEDLHNHDAEVCKFTEDGGLAIRMVNGTDHTSIKGEVVSVSTSFDGQYILQANEYDAVGAVYEAGIAVGEPVWVTVSGKAKVLLENTQTAATGQIAISAPTDGRARFINNPGSGLPAVDTHFKEIGHCIETVSAGTDKLVTIVMHFN